MPSWPRMRIGRGSTRRPLTIARDSCSLVEPDEIPRVQRGTKWVRRSQTSECLFAASLEPWCSSMLGTGRQVCYALPLIPASTTVYGAASDRGPRTGRRLWTGSCQCCCFELCCVRSHGRSLSSSAPPRKGACVRPRGRLPLVKRAVRIANTRWLVVTLRIRSMSGSSPSPSSSAS